MARIQFLWLRGGVYAKAALPRIRGAHKIIRGAALRSSFGLYFLFSRFTKQKFRRNFCFLNREIVNCLYLGCAIYWWVIQNFPPCDCCGWAAPQSPKRPTLSPPRPQRGYVFHVYFGGYLDRSTAIFRWRVVYRRLLNALPRGITWENFIGARAVQKALEREGAPLHRNRFSPPSSSQKIDVIWFAFGENEKGQN